MGRRSSKKRRSGGKPVKTETGMTLTGVNADNYREGMSNPALVGGGGAKMGGVGQAVKPQAFRGVIKPRATSKAQNMLGGIAQQQPVGKPMSPEAIATAQAAQGAQLQKAFKAANPNAPKMPAGIGIAGAPANIPMPDQGFRTGPQQSQQMPRRGKGGQNPTGGKGAMRPSPQSSPQGKTFTGMDNERGGNPGGPPGMMARPRPNMSRGGKGGQSPIGGGKGARRPSPSMGRPNPAASLPANTLASRMADGSAGPAQIGAMSENLQMTQAPMMKKAPAFKMRSKTSTTFKEMGSSGVNKKSAPTRKTSTGYKMPGYGNR